MMHSYDTAKTMRRRPFQRYRQGAHAVVGAAPTWSFLALTVLSGLGMATLTTALWLLLIQNLSF